MTDLSLEMKATAEYAIKAAKEIFGQEIDLSEQSLTNFENLLSQAYQSISCRVKDENTAQVIKRTANIWGAYFGEMILKTFGGSWVVKGSDRLIIVSGFEFSPINFIHQKITNHPEFSAKAMFSEIRKKIPNQTKDQFTQEEMTEFIHPVSSDTSIMQKRNSSDFDIKPKFIIAIIFGVLLIAAGCILSINLLQGGGISNEFQSNLNTFLVAAEKLNVMTDQGVSNGDFRNQLAEVKSAYSSLTGSWPQSFSTEEDYFTEAIYGWDLTLKVWDYGLEGSSYLNMQFLPEGSTLLNDCSEYSNYDIQYAMYNSVEGWIGILMGSASQYYEQGRNGVTQKLH